MLTGEQFTVLFIEVVSPKPRSPSTSDVFLIDVVDPESDNAK